MCSMSRSEPPGGASSVAASAWRRLAGSTAAPAATPDSAVAPVSIRRRVSSGQAEAGACGVSADRPGRLRRVRYQPRPTMNRASRHAPMITGPGGPPRCRRRAGGGRARYQAELDDPVVPGVGHPDRPGRGDRHSLRKLQVLARPSRVRLQAELGVEAAVRAEYRHQSVVRLGEVDPAGQPDRDAARVAEIAVARLGHAERAELMPGRGVLANRAGRGVAGARHPDVAAGVQRDAGRRRHRERGAVAAAGGELHDPAVALVSDPDVAGGSDRERHRVVQLAVAASGRSEDGQDPAGRGELHHPVVAGVRDPDMPGRVGGDSGRLVQVRAEGGQFPPGGGELHHPVVAGVRDPDVAGRIDGYAGRSAQRLLPRYTPERRRVRQRVRPRCGRRPGDGAGQRARPGSQRSGDEDSGGQAGAYEGDYPRPPAAPPRLLAHRPAR